MEMLRNRYCAAFAADKHQIASGDLHEVARATKEFVDSNPTSSVLIFDANSELVEIDFRGSAEDVLERIRKAQGPTPATEIEVKTGPGRPKLGVVSKEVTLLPRHWEWLATQPGGASVTIRKLVDAARKQGDEPDRARRTREIAYKFMSAMAGNEVNFEEASRALFAGDEKRLRDLIQVWPADLRNHVATLLGTTSGDNGPQLP